jgi:hypothetical protein
MNKEGPHNVHTKALGFTRLFGIKVFVCWASKKKNLSMFG